MGKDEKIIPPRPLNENYDKAIHQKPLRPTNYTPPPPPPQKPKDK